MSDHHQYQTIWREQLPRPARKESFQFSKLFCVDNISNDPTSSKTQKFCYCCSVIESDKGYCEATSVTHKIITYTVKLFQLLSLNMKLLDVEHIYIFTMESKQRLIGQFAYQLIEWQKPFLHVSSHISKYVLTRYLLQCNNVVYKYYIFNKPIKSKTASSQIIKKTKNRFPLREQMPRGMRPQVRRPSVARGKGKK